MLQLVKRVERLVGFIKQKWLEASLGKGNKKYKKDVERDVKKVK